ncbi:MAG TPA: ATP phosphoribosyltransferase, partial [Pirellulales bacterium]
MTNLRIGIPSKGRLEQVASELLQQAGLNFRRQDRTLFAKVRDMPVDVVFLRADDIPTLCAEGAIDFGITGGDLIAESRRDSDLIRRLPLNAGACSLALCVPIDSSLQTAAELHGKRVATSFPRVTEEYLAKHKAKAHLVELMGSVEIMIQLGVADAIVDLVETGSTLAANRLRLFERIGHYEMMLIQNTAQREGELADRIVRRLEGAVIARGYSLLEYNVPRARLA